MNRLKAIYRSWGIACAGQQVYVPCYRSEWLAKITEARADPGGDRQVNWRPYRDPKLGFRRGGSLK
jgi:hypothetical protein